MRQITINHKGSLRAKSGHPWIFRSDILSIEGEGPIAVVKDMKGKFLAQALFSPESQIALRIISWKPAERESIDKAFLKKKILAAKDRRSFMKDRECLRLVFGESDQLPSLIVDQYKDVLCFQTLSAGMEFFKEDIVQILIELFNPRSIVERNDVPVRTLEGLLLEKGVVYGEAPSEHWVNWISDTPEVKMRVDVLEGQKTGLFLDQAVNHHLARSYAYGRALDVFTYQGGFALAIASQVDQVIAVDRSREALHHLQENSVENHISNIETIESNAFDFLKNADQDKERFDTIILDPPPFVRSRKDLDKALGGYKELNLRAMRLLNPGGLLITASCSQNLTQELFEKVLLEASRDTKRDVQIIERRGGSPDHPVLLNFPESDYLHAYFLRIL